MLGGEPGNEARNITQNWNCIALYNLSMQALVDLRKSLDSHSAAANEGCNGSMSLHNADHNLQAPPPKFEKTYLLFQHYSLCYFHSKPVPTILKLC